MNLVLGNYDLDSSKQFASLNKQVLDKPDQLKVQIILTGDMDSTRDSALKAGEYPANYERYNRISSVKIHHVVDGKEEVKNLNSRDWKGKIVITSVEGKTIKGEIDLSEGDTSIKGTFTSVKSENVK